MTLDFEQLQPPQILYKYRRLYKDWKCDEHNEYTVSMLKDGEIYFATPDELNDPFENFFWFKQEQYVKVTAEELKEIDTKQPKPQSDGTYLVKLDEKNFTKYIYDNYIKQTSRGIFSLCESNVSLPMYCHYADAYKGICIGFDWRQFELEFDGSSPSSPNVPRKVSYHSEPPKIPDCLMNIYMHLLRNLKIYHGRKNGEFFTKKKN